MKLIKYLVYKIINNLYYKTWETSFNLVCKTNSTVLLNRSGKKVWIIYSVYLALDSERWTFNDNIIYLADTFKRELFDFLQKWGDMK